MADPQNNVFYRYYAAQLGSGPGPYYMSHYRVQRGRGFWGSALRSIWGFLKPLIGPVAGEGLRTASNITQDVISSPGRSLEDIARQRGREGIQNLTDKAVKALSGRGKKRKRKAAARPRKKRRQQSTASTRKRRTPLTAHSIQDIFSPSS